jgi:hypothetical protein
LIGTGRCGSTLVHQLLARHPDVGFISNLEDRVPGLPANARRSGNALDRHVPVPASGASWLRYAPSEAYRALVCEVSPMVTEPSRDLVAADAVPWLADRLESFFATRACAQRKPVFLHKFTGWPRTGVVLQVFPRPGSSTSSATAARSWRRA